MDTIVRQCSLCFVGPATWNSLPHHLHISSVLMAAIGNAFDVKLVRSGWSMENSLVVLLVPVINTLDLIGPQC